MTVCEKIFDKIDELYEQYLNVWEDICNIESPTNCKAGVDAVGRYISAIAEKRGWEVEVFRQSVSGDVVSITMNPHSPLAPITLSGHTDTVHPVGSFGKVPTRRDGDKIYGPGVTDCKGGIVAALLAMDALFESRFTSRPVRLLLQSDEENGSQFSDKATINYICEKSKDSIAFLNLERMANGKACLIRKGILNYEFKITGKEAHAANCATEGANAIAEAAHKILELEKLKDKDGITCSCGVISGGSASNTVPLNCTFKANIRFATQQQLEWVSAYVQEIADTVYVPGCRCEATLLSKRVAMELCDRNIQLLEKMNTIFEQNGFCRLEIGSRNGGSDAADVTVYGIPCVDSIGVMGENIHSIDEYAILRSLAESAKRLASVIYCI